MGQAAIHVHDADGGQATWSEGSYTLRIMVFSGDDDTVCGSLGTQAWIHELGYDITSKWTSWTYEHSVYGNQVGGYITHFGGAGLTFATVHGAGHEVPTYKGEAALELLSKYFADEL